MKAIDKRKHEWLRIKLFKLAQHSANPETREAAADALLALQQQYETYQEMIEQLKDCISTYEEMQKYFRSDLVVPALREERKERNAIKYSVRDFQLMAIK